MLNNSTHTGDAVTNPLNYRLLLNGVEIPSSVVSVQYGLSVATDLANSPQRPGPLRPVRGPQSCADESLGSRADHRRQRPCPGHSAFREWHLHDSNARPSRRRGNRAGTKRTPRRSRQRPRTHRLHPERAKCLSHFLGRRRPNPTIQSRVPSRVPPPPTAAPIRRRPTRWPSTAMATASWPGPRRITIRPQIATTTVPLSASITPRVSPLHRSFKSRATTAPRCRRSAIRGRGLRR